MITEDYVSFEVAKLLKEKGFDEKTFAYYLVHPNSYAEPFDKKDEYPCAEDIWIKRPTLQMVMKWLREVHNIHIIVQPYTDIEGHHFNFLFDTYAYGCWQELAIYITDSWNTYEEACEAAIKYCLTNLI